MKEEILNNTKELLEIPSVIGDLEFALNKITSKFNDINPNLKIEKCPENHYLIVSGEQPNSQIVTGHIDRHGLVINQDNEIEFAAFKRGRDFDPNVGIGVPKRFIESLYSDWVNKLIGTNVFAYNSKTGKKISEGRINQGILDIDNLKLKFQVDGLKKCLNPGTSIAHKSNYNTSKRFFSGQIDNCISTAVMYEMFKSGFQGSLILSDDEESGNSYLHIKRALEKMNIEKTDQLIVLDTTPFENSKKLESGIVVLRNRDEYGKFNSKMVKKLEEKLCESGSEILFKDKYQEEIALEKGESVKYGKTELGQVVNCSNGLINGATIQIPTMNYHTNSETASHLGLENYTLAIKAVLGLR